MDSSKSDVPVQRTGSDEQIAVTATMKGVTFPYHKCINARQRNMFNFFGTKIFLYFRIISSPFRFMYEESIRLSSILENFIG